MPFESRSDNDPATSWVAFYHDDRLSAPFSIFCLILGSQPPHLITETSFFYTLTECIYVCMYTSESRVKVLVALPKLVDLPSPHPTDMEKARIPFRDKS